MSILTTPRTPTFSGTEEIPWKNVGKSFHDFMKAYCAIHRTKQDPEEFKAFNDCPKDIKQWMSKHSILGNPEADVFGMGVMLPVVNPKTGKLNRGGVLSAGVYVSKITDISEKTLEATKELLHKLYTDNFNKKPSVESLQDIIVQLKELDPTIDVNTYLFITGLSAHFDKDDCFD